MPRLAELYIATRTRSVEGAETSDPPALLVSQGTEDLFQVPLDSDTNGLRRGKAALFRVDLDDRVIDSEDIQLRLIATGNDAWAPEQIIAWGVTSRADGLRVIPLAAQIDLATPLTNQSAGLWLSTDRSEGVPTLMLRRVGQGATATDATRIVVVIATSQYDGFDIAGPGPAHPFDEAGSKAEITLQAGGPAGLLLDYRLPQTRQDDRSLGSANLYMTNVPGPFSRADLASGSFVLSVANDDWWVPVYVAVFGLDTAFGQPNALIPFVHAPTSSLLRMSTDPGEGWESNRLPTAEVVGLDLTVPVGPGELAGPLFAAGGRSGDATPPGRTVPVVRVRPLQA